MLRIGDWVTQYRKGFWQIIDIKPMCKIKNSLKQVCGWIVVGIVVIICCSCNKSFSEITPEIKSLMSEQYGVFIPNSAQFIEAEYKVVLERDPYLKVTFDLAEKEMYSLLNNEMWNTTDLRFIINSEIGTSLSVEWKYRINDSDLITHSYYADMNIEKLTENMYRVHFCGFKVNTQYFEE